MGESPTSLKKYLGRELRRLRVKVAKLPPTAVMAALNCSRSKVTKIETGQVGMREAELKALLDLYQADDKKREELVRVAAEARKRGWWASAKLGMSIPDWFRMFVGLEASAEEIWIRQIEVIPGLLQVESYTRALIKAMSPDASETDIEGRLKVRAGRQARLLGLDPPRIVVVLSEAAVRQTVGGKQVMAEQLSFLLKVTQTLPVEIYVVPFSSGAHAAFGFSFTLLRDSDADEPSDVYVDGLSQAQYLDSDHESEDVGVYRDAFERAREAAYNQDASRELLGRVLAECESE